MRNEQDLLTRNSNLSNNKHTSCRRRKRMEENVSTLDRVVRAVVATLIIVLYLKGWIKGLAGLLLVASGALLSSVLSGYCPLYEQLGISTRE